MQFKSVQPELIRYEMRMVQGVDPHVKEQKKPGFFGRLLSGLGKVLGAVAAPLSFIFPPAAIGAAGMYGLGQIGDMMQAKAAQKQMQQMQQQNIPVSFPGLEMGNAGIQPASFNMSARDEQIMDVLFARNSAMNQMAHMI